MRQFARWLQANGVSISVDATGLPNVTTEVSPLFGYDEDSFADAWRSQRVIPEVREGLYLE